MIGVIADDVTGATDVAAALSRAGLRTLLALTAEPEDREVDADAIVIGLKTRSIPAPDAVEQSLTALRTLQRWGADRFYVKYCSTFDSTPAGNIGPVTEALAAELGARTVVTTPAAPLHGRTVYRGHLFVGDALLDETHMRDHPITPMRDSSVPRLLIPQVCGQVGLLPLATVREGAASIQRRIAEAEADGTAHLVVDAVADDDLAAIAEAVAGRVLVAGSAGLVGALALLAAGSRSDAALPPQSRTAIIAGSCSRRTLEQIADYRAGGGPAYRLVATPGETAESLASRALEWWDAQPDGRSALLYSSSNPDERETSAPGDAELYEETAGLLATRLAGRGIRRLLIAGGETSGAVIRALGTDVAVVEREVAPGVPWIHDTANDLHLVLKSGNFGEPGFFTEVAGAGSAA